MTEAEIQAQIMLAVGSLPDVRIFRNNTGEAWQGRVIHRDARSITLGDPRAIVFGLCPGSSDLIGFLRGRFLALEVKTPLGRPTPEQVRFGEVVNRFGGLAGVVRSPEEALRFLKQGSPE